MRICSWNVNGLRAAMAKGEFLRWLAQTPADIVGVQEVRATDEQLVAERAQWRDWHCAIFAAERKGYSGVGLFSRRPPDVLTTRLGEPAFDVEGRLQVARFGKLVVANVYFPNGNGRARDNSRIPYKLAFYRRLFDLLEEEKRAGGRIVVMGDFNTAHREIDLARPKQNVGTSGFTPVEREELDRWLRAGWVDTFRAFEPGPDHYTWWSQRFGVREKNVGWRIDMVLASPGAMPFVRSAFIERDVMGSDHCPIGVDVDDGILRA